MPEMKKKSLRTRGIMLRNITSKEDMCKNCAKCSKGFKIGTNQSYTVKASSPNLNMVLLTTKQRNTLRSYLKLE